MEETVLSLPQETIAALETISQRTGQSRNELIQAAVHDFIQRNQQQSTRPRSIGMGNSGRSDLSRRSIRASRYECDGVGGTISNSTDLNLRSTTLQPCQTANNAIF